MVKINLNFFVKMITQIRTMAAKQIMSNINEYMNAFLVSHGGIDMEEFGEEYPDTDVTTIANTLMEKIVEAYKSDTNQEQIMALVAQRAKKEPGEKKLRDPDKPTRGKSAYLFFCQDHRAAAKEELEEALGEDEKVTVGQVTKKLGEMWKEFKKDRENAEEMAVYEASATEDKERYDEQMKGYTELTQEEIAAKVGPKKARKTAGAKKDPNAIKRPKSAYIFYCGDWRETVKQELTEANDEVPSSPEVTTELGVRWSDIKNSINPKDVAMRKKYEMMAEGDKKRYNTEKASESAEGDVKPSAKPSAKPSVKVVEKVVEKVEEKVEEVARVVPKRAAKKLSPFALYNKEMRPKIAEENPDMKGADLVRNLGIMWREMPESEKQEWIEKAEG
jgi:high mobility group protein B2